MQGGVVDKHRKLFEGQVRTERLQGLDDGEELFLRGGVVRLGWNEGMAPEAKGAVVSLVVGLKQGVHDFLVTGV